MRISYVGVLIAALGAVTHLAAGPITYTETGQISGSLGSTILTNAAFTFIFQGDTADITNAGPSVLLNPAISNSLLIGSSSGSFTTPVEVGVATNGTVGFSDLSDANGITFTTSAAIGYGLATPISLSGGTATFATGTLVTSDGTLTINGAQNLTFTAAVATSPNRERWG